MEQYEILNSVSESTILDDVTLIPDHVDSEQLKDKVRQKCAKFLTWCKDMGISHPKITYPEFFEGGLIGCKVNTAISYREGFLFVPLSATISVDKCLEDQTLKSFYKQNPQLFQKGKHRAWEHFILTAFLMYHKQLGSESIWAPWIEQMPDVTFFADQDSDEIMATMDPYLISEAIEFKEQIAIETEQFLKVLDCYPELFNAQTRQSSNFRSVYAQVWTRCFGYNLPSTSLVPMADNFNHTDIRAGYQLVTQSLHVDQSCCDEKSDYFTKDKYMNDYSQLFTEEETKLHPEVTGRLSKTRFDQNNHNFSDENFNTLCSHKQIWQIPFIQNNYDEDADTSSSDEDSSPPDKIQSLLDLIKNLQDNNTSHMSKKLIRHVQQVGPIRYFIKRQQTQPKYPYSASIISLDQNEYINVETEAKLTDQKQNRFDWYQPPKHSQETYFVYVNLQRRTLQPDEQAYYCYGRRCNRYLLLNYGFCFMDNRYDSYKIRVKVELNYSFDKLNKENVKQMLQFGDLGLFQEIKLKSWKLNDVLMAYFRLYCSRNYFGNEKCFEISFGAPLCLKYEMYCLDLYSRLINFLHKKVEIPNQIEQDKQMLLNKSLSWGFKMSILYRIEQKKIIRAQLRVVKVLKFILSKAEQGCDSNSFREAVLKVQEGESADTHEYQYLRLINSDYIHAIYQLAAIEQNHDNHK